MLPGLLQKANRPGNFLGARVNSFSTISLYFFELKNIDKKTRNITMDREAEPMS